MPKLMADIRVAVSSTENGGSPTDDRIVNSRQVTAADQLSIVESGTIQHPNHVSSSNHVLPSQNLQ
ncbi:unnamed protein product [Spirodela intermedia]|uniref:Uncharacterized protein n=1 Tax=Spirodela intermedia TaxID=51605 RepID=A0A7I8ICF0_SPIIN|nr:unnamed protein product [Spirodela intermedia]CAA6655291.1 unnamed protein product [Spirodela intermedia]